MGSKHGQLTLAITAALACGSAMAQERARVLSAVPVVQQVGVAQQFCEDVQIYSGHRRRGDGAVAGAVAGHARGGSNGYTEPREHPQDARRGRPSTAELVVGGALGHVIDGNHSQPSHDVARRCTNETVYENRTVGYDVTYEYAGQRHTARMDHNPGPWVPVQVQPQGRYSSSGNNHGHAVVPGVSYQSSLAGSVVTESITYTQPSIPIVIGVDVDGGRPSRPPHGHRPPPPPWR